MKVFRLPVVAATLVVASELASAQFVKGNEAVKMIPGAAMEVETPPIPGAGLPAPCPAERPGCASSGWRMVETSEGLRECTEIYARPGTCRMSTYGTEKRTRVWIIKSRGQWMQCQRPEIGSKCVSTMALPLSEVQ